jgi:hypothetical protein
MSGAGAFSHHLAAAALVPDLHRQPVSSVDGGDGFHPDAVEQDAPGTQLDAGMSPSAI